MNKQDYKNELLQIISYEYEETFRKKVIKKFKSMKIVLPIMYTIYIYITLKVFINFDYILAILLGASVIGILIMTALSAGKINKNYIDPNFKLMMYNIQNAIPQEIMKNGSSYAITYGCKKKSVVPDKLTKMVIINNRQYYKNKRQEYVLFIDLEEREKFVNINDLKKKIISREDNYSFNQELESKVKKYNIKIILMDLILRSAIIFIIGYSTAVFLIKVLTV